MMRVAATATDASHRHLSPQDALALPVVAAGGGTSGLCEIETRLRRASRTVRPLRHLDHGAAQHADRGAHPSRRSHGRGGEGALAFRLWTRSRDAATRALPSGSFYTEPADDPHFAWTGPEGATVYIADGVIRHALSRGEGLKPASIDFVPVLDR
jgi:hypothetical protein